MITTKATQMSMLLLPCHGSYESSELLTFHEIPEISESNEMKVTEIQTYGLSQPLHIIIHSLCTTSC